LSNLYLGLPVFEATVQAVEEAIINAWWQLKLWKELTEIKPMLYHTTYSLIYADQRYWE